MIVEMAGKCKFTYIEIQMLLGTNAILKNVSDWYQKETTQC